MVDLEKVRYPSMTQVKYSSSLGPSWQLRLGWGWAGKLELDLAKLVMWNMIVLILECF